MNKITTALLGLSTLLGISGCGAKQSNSQQAMNEDEDDGYTFVATLFSSTDDPNIGLAHYYLKNPDGTLYLDIHNEENDLTPDTLLEGKIFVYYWDVVSYAFFCKRPEAGKPIEVRVGDEWKTLESSAHIQIDSTGKFLQQYTYVPRGEEGERLPLDFYPNPKVAPGKKITLIQDSFGRGFFIRDVQGEWMKIQGIDYSACPDREGVIEEEEWAKVSKASEVNPSYWIHWREGSKILIYPNEFIHKYSV
jgi:lipoprotein